MDGLSISCIANLLGRHRSAISRQFSNKKNLDFLRVKGKIVRTYSAIKAQDNYSKNKSNCGAKYKLFQDNNLIKYIEDCVVKKKWSPEVAIGRAKLVGWKFKIHISAKSIYNYIDRNQINISPFDLRFRLRRRKPKKQYIKQNKKKLSKSKEISLIYILITFNLFLLHLFLINVIRELLINNKKIRKSALDFPDIFLLLISS